MPAVRLHTIAMDTLVSLTLVDADEPQQRFGQVRRWFLAVEKACNRFDPRSELRGLMRRAGAWTPASPILFHALELATAVAAASDGAFDPTLGAQLTNRGFDRNYQTQARIPSPRAEGDWRHIELDPERRRVRLARPLALDLGALAKGLALDLAACELADLPGFALDAGGDLRLGGRSEDGRPWRVGIRDPRQPEVLLTTLTLSGQAVCTSAGYARPGSIPGEHHLLDPRAQRSPRTLGATVIAPVAAVADALATAAQVLGPHDGIRLLEQSGVEGLIVADDGGVVATRALAELAA